MTKLNKKLLVFFGVLLCSLCLIFGIAACSNGEHVHTFSAEWKSNATIHWHAATCIHAGERSGQGEHNFNDQGKCTVCGYQSTEEHEHTFGGLWLYDGAEGHYQLATCHPEVKSELEPHVDENEDDICDVCDFAISSQDGGSTEHEHTFEGEWSFNENKHWHEATCEHFIERSDYSDHSFTNGVCECGVKESEVKVYNLYKNSPEYDLYFVQWLDWLAENNIVEVEYTLSGDGIYHYADGTSEVRFLGQRTLKVKAQSGGEPLADVWFMITLYTDNVYYQNGNTIALGIAKTNSSGVAEITFSPIAGYSSATVEYRIRVALAADVAEELGIYEENAKPIPNRYEVSGTNFEYVTYEVGENSSAEDIAATVNFAFSKGWNAYNTITLPYHRYYQDQINGEDIQEAGSTYEFTLSGENLFDYFYFTPAKYSFASGETVEDFAKIEENAKIAASGIYKISFSVEGNANVTLYYWNEQGVNMGAYHATKPDGTPSDDYITSISGGTAGDGKYTGGNYVDVVVTPANGLRNYQLGIISDAAVKITFTVERIGDYEEKRNDGTLGVGENNSVSATIAGNGATTPITLDNVPAGLYALTLTPDETFSLSGAEILSAYTDKTTNNTSLWEYGTSSLRGLFKGIINIAANTEVVYIQNNGTEDFEGILTLEQYTIPELEVNAYTNVPAANAKANNNASDYIFEIPLGSSVISGNYYIEVTLCGANVCGRMYMVTVGVGDREYAISTTFYTTSVTYSTYIKITDDEHYITINNNTAIYNSFMARVRLVYVPEVEESSETLVNITSTDRSKLFIFKAEQSGTYKITMTVVDNNNLRYVYVFNAQTDKRIIEQVTSGQIDALSGTFELNEGEEIILKIYTNYLIETSFNFVIEYVEN